MIEEIHNLNEGTSIYFTENMTFGLKIKGSEFDKTFSLDQSFTEPYVSLFLDSSED